MKIDFIIRYDPATMTAEDIAKRILHTLIIKRLKRNFPVTIFVGGKSGSGKSMTCVKLQQILCELQDLDFNTYIDCINCYTPLEYMKKSDAIITEKELKKLNILTVHEARLLISSKDWQSIAAQTVNNTINLQRAIKPQCLFIVSQFIKDITVDTRRSLDYYFKIYRPLGQKARIYIKLLYMDERDIEKPKLRDRGVMGKLVFPDGTVRIFKPEYIEVTMPDKEIQNHFKRKDYETKAPIIQKQLREQIALMEKELGNANAKNDAIVNYYSSNPEALMLVAKQFKRGWKLKQEAYDMHELNKADAKIIEQRINEKICTHDYISPAYRDAALQDHLKEDEIDG